MANNQNQMNTNERRPYAVMLRTVIIFAICICAILLVSQFDAVKNVAKSVISVLSPVLTGVILAYIINPIDRMLEKAFKRIFSKFKKLSPLAVKKISRSFSITLSMIFLIAMIVLLLFLILPDFWESLVRLVDIAPDLFDVAVARLDEFLKTDNALVKNLGGYIDTIGASITAWFETELMSAVSGVVESVIAVVGIIVDFLIALVICVYALIEKRSFISQSKKIIFALFKPSVANDILDVARYSHTVFGKYISGKILTSTIVGIVTFVFMSVCGMPYALLSAGIIAVTNVIPFFGPFIGGIPTAFIVLVTNPKQGIIYIIFLVVLQQIEGNIIEPLIMEDKTGVSKFWITAALLVFGGVFGLVGMIFSVPFVAVLFYCIRKNVERKLEKKSLPIPSRTYLNVDAINTENGTLCEKTSQPVRKKIRERISEWRKSKRSSDDDLQDE